MNEQNLRKLTTSEAREIGKKGGKASVGRDGMGVGLERRCFVSFLGKRFQPMSRDNVYISLLMG